MNANHFITQEDRKLVEAAVADAEKRTSAEIVCAVATESGRYDRAESIVGIFGSLAGLLLANAIDGCSCGSVAGWSVEPGLSILWQCVAVVAGFLAGSVLASYWHGLRRSLVSGQEFGEETRRAAAFVFSQARLASTRESGGVLLYVSLFEHRVIVLADDGVMKAAGQEFLDKLRDLAVARLREGHNLETFIDTIRTAADVLSAKLPAAKSNIDELPNKFLIFHPRP